MKDRFAKLAALTRGAAVVGLGLGAMAGCTKNDPAAPPTAVNGAIQPDPAAAGDTSDGGAGVALGRRRFPIPNALPGGRFRDGGFPDLTAPGGADGGTPSGQ